MLIKQHSELIKSNSVILSTIS